MEKSKLWVNETFSGVELLSARYTKFEFTKHWHDELAIGVIEDGAEGLLYRGKNIIIPKRHIIAINPAEVHTGFSGTPNGWRYRMFYFNLNELSSQFANRGLPIDPIINQPIIYDELLFDVLLQLHISLELASFQLTKESLFTLALEQLFTQYGSAKKEVFDSICSKSSYLARDFIHDNFELNPSLTELEYVSNCSKFQLIKSFKTLFGVTPHQYLLLVKVNHAKKLLSKGVSCIETSLSCGFYDQSHFTRNFKRAFGTSPSNYRVCKS
ncbi:AraC family transcriptional regulator [Pseudoalteromonas denitrificans]|uniref:Transcriptional regulator, AraC family n=1 Tax=Pseudoalteromonas denitrificans DSM 6059 TaxID=1123010 RepID=A0A1I1PE15_9GAMM|nr:AraC family transcriptional regulator [Pseudoalteromonas denitrificans]SFD07936.1 transcriptional regulator, AraC family [Pseudoalteromonas denitrificans DSM 6059]